MARPEKPLDPEAGPLQAFAFDLRRLREKAGSPSYRKLAEHAHYSAAALARAAAGNALPTLDLTLAYVTACGGDVEEWQQRWHAIENQQRPPTTAEHISPPSPTTPSPKETPPEETPPPAEDAPQRPAGRGRRSWLMTLGAATLLTVGTTVALVVWPDGPPSMNWANASNVLPPPDKLGQALVDGADPKRAGCPDAVTAVGQEVWLGSVAYGTLELRYSQKCVSAWARLNPYGSLINNSSQDIRIRLETFRPDDSTASRVDEAFLRDQHWAGMLRTDKGCVKARGQITIDSNASEVVETICVKR
ncbi:helix-turn-helix domain-containing protein [Streptosporangium sp. NPDC020145]|uniref:helix-turn-helix domain-containing protein n=1 Tax=Streptosporangium sp. NPDC020145 TaxID=3154694 RepID=UPI003443050E